MKFKDYYHLFDVWEYNREQFNIEDAKAFIVESDFSNTELQEIVRYASMDRVCCTELIIVLVEMYGLNVVPTNVNYIEKVYDEIDHIHAGFYGHLFYTAANFPQGSSEKKRYMELIRYLKNKGFESDVCVRISGDGYRSGDFKDYRDLFVRIDDIVQEC